MAHVLVEESIVDPRAPLSDLSDELADVPEWITPDRLTSHSSGLPRSLALDIRRDGRCGLSAFFGARPCAICSPRHPGPGPA